VGVAGRPGPGDTSDTPGDAPPPQPPRAPRPGDPFATAAGPAPAPNPKRKRRKGRTFFIFLLVTGGVLAVGTLLVFLTFRNMTVGFYHDVVVPRGIPEALPPGYPKADAVRLVTALDDFFARADEGAFDDDRVIEVIEAIETAMADRLITPEEAEGLIATAHRAGAALPAEPAAPAAPTTPNGGEG